MSLSSASSINGKNDKLKTNISNQEKKKKNVIPSRIIKKEKLIEPQHIEGTNTNKKFSQLPSATLHKHKQSSPWGTAKKKHLTSFGYMYSSGGIPCRINHGGVKHTLVWDEPPENLQYDPILIVCCDGFGETEHPYVFLARAAFKDLINANGAKDKVIAILPKIMNSIRISLMSKVDDVFSMSLVALKSISELVGQQLNEYLPKLLQQIHRKLMVKQFQNPVTDLLHTFVNSGGKEAMQMIKTKIPTFTSL